MTITTEPTMNPAMDLDEPLSRHDAVIAWLARFESALAGNDRSALAPLIAEDCNWRDVLAFTWSITPYTGARAVIDGLLAAQPRTRARGFHIPKGSLEPRDKTRLGVEVIEAIFAFETEIARGKGVLRLDAGDPLKALVIMTSAEELKGFEEPIERKRPSGLEFSLSFGEPNWQDRREIEARFDDREPEVLIIGAGQAGLAMAARLKLLGVDALVVEKAARVGDNWRKRYHSLVLHNQTHANHLPYIPFPPSWPIYLPKDMLAGWMEMYAWAMQCNVWTSSEFLSGRHDEATGRWEANVRRADGTERTLRPAHVIFANGVCGIPYLPKLPGIEEFKGDFIHASRFGDGSPWRGKRALVLGTGASGHDIAQDLHASGADVTIMQKGSTTVVSITPSGKLTYAIYDEGGSLDESDLLAISSTYPLLVKGHRLMTARIKEIDKALIDGLVARGFRHDYGEDETGHQMKFRRRGGGYYMNAGCSDLIVAGKIKLIHNEDLDRYVPSGALLKSGEVREYDVIVAATGYISQREYVGRLLGQGVAEKIGPIWGTAEDGELANMYRPTAQKGLWFIGGSMAQCRIYSRTLALQIKARLAGLDIGRED